VKGPITILKGHLGQPSLGEGSRGAHALLEPKTEVNSFLKERHRPWKFRAMGVCSGEREWREGEKIEEGGYLLGAEFEVVPSCHHQIPRFV
jgi:hypothetical protein